MSSTQKKINHLDVLEERHRELDKEITRKYNSFVGDEEITALKLKKLKIKQEIQHLKSNLPK